MSVILSTQLGVKHFIGFTVANYLYWDAAEATDQDSIIDNAFSAASSQGDEVGLDKATMARINRTGALPRAAQNGYTYERGDVGGSTAFSSHNRILSRHGNGTATLYKFRRYVDGKLVGTLHEGTVNAA